MDYKGTLPNGDIVLRVKLWDGEVDLQYSSGKVGVGQPSIFRVDDTPTYQWGCPALTDTFLTLPEPC